MRSLHAVAWGWCSPGRWISLISLVTALFTATPTAFADPYEDNPGAVAGDPDYAAAKVAIRRGDWSEAVKRLDQAVLRAPENADLQNYLGYSYRNLGNFELAFRHYRRALELSPRHRGAHEYIGQAYLLTNDLAKAEEHLAALERICLLPCDELDDLKQSIVAYRKKNQK